MALTMTLMFSSHKTLHQSETHSQLKSGKWLIIDDQSRTYDKNKCLYLKTTILKLIIFIYA